MRWGLKGVKHFNVVHAFFSRSHCATFLDHLYYYRRKLRIKSIFVENVKICGNSNLWLELVDMLLLIQILFPLKFLRIFSSDDQSSVFANFKFNNEFYQTVIDVHDNYCKCITLSRVSYLPTCCKLNFR